MRRSASQVIRELEIRIARLERQAMYQSLNELAFEQIQKRWKGLNGVFKRMRHGIEIKKPVKRAGSVYFYVDGIDGVLELYESQSNENELIVDHKVVGAGVVKSFTIDATDFMHKHPMDEEWDLSNPQGLGIALRRGLNLDPNGKY